MKTESDAKLVVDASVMGAMFFQEPEAHFAEKRLLNCKWIAPTLLDYEMGSIFLKKIKLYPKLRSQLEESYKIFCASAIELVDVPVFASVAIAEKYGVTTYDASYFWLASTLDVDFFTFDKALKAAWSKR